MTDFHYNIKRQATHTLRVNRLKLIEIINYYEEQHAAGDGKRFTVPDNAEATIEGRAPGAFYALDTVELEWVV